MHVCEESHCGVVPMNHSNKDGTASPESGEGRVRLKENALSSDTYPTLSGTARVPRMGECADKPYIWPLYLREENGCAKQRSSGSERGAISDGRPYRARQLSRVPDTTPPLSLT